MIKRYVINQKLPEVNANSQYLHPTEKNVVFS